jgi:membrane associated rhomboid family serine protease
MPRPYYSSPNSSPNSSPLGQWLQSGCPLTIAIIAINFLTMALATFRVPPGAYLALSIPQSLFRPWTLLTYPLVSFEIIGVIFYGLWLYFVGGSLERSWGTRFYGLFFFLMALISALGLIAGALLLRVPVMADNWLAIAALTLTWCLLNPNETIRFNFFIPIQAKWLGIFEVLIIFFTYARFHPLMGFFALSGCAAAFAWVRYRPWRDIGHYTVRTRPRVARSTPRDDKRTARDLNPFEYFARKRRKKRFERLMKDD